MKKISTAAAEKSGKVGSQKLTAADRSRIQLRSRTQT
jgi:hypothetical protein